MIEPFRRIRTANDELRQLQDATAVVFASLAGRSLIDGVLIKDLAFTASVEKTVNHFLGREIEGWLVVKKNATADIWDGQATNPTPTRTLRLTASADVTISLWVF
jgi:hypothetical protein